MSRGRALTTNLPCLAEKECFALGSICDELMEQMVKNGAYRISGAQIDKLVEIALHNKDGKYSLNKKWVGKDASLFLKELGIASDARLIIMETESGHPFVQEELMMPILPIVRVNNISEAIRLAVEAEHGNRHSALSTQKRRPRPRLRARWKRPSLSRTRPPMPALARAARGIRRLPSQARRARG